MSKVDNTKYIDTVEYLVTKSFKLGNLLLQLEREEEDIDIRQAYRTMYLSLVGYQEELVNMRGLKYEISMESAFKTLQAKAFYGLSGVHDGLMLLDDNGKNALKIYKRISGLIEALYDAASDIQLLGNKETEYEYGVKIREFQCKINALKYYYLFNAYSAMEIAQFKN